MLEAQIRFENAVRIAPDFANAWVELGDTYRYCAGRGQMDRQQGVQLARQAAATVLAIYPEHPGAYVLRGRIARSFDRDWQFADADFQKAASLDPGNDAAADESLHALISKYGDVWYYQIALVFAYTGRPDEAFAWLDKAYAARDTGMTALLKEPFLENLHDDPR